MENTFKDLALNRRIHKLNLTNKLMKKLLVFAMLSTGLLACGQKETAKEETKTAAVASDSTGHAEMHGDSAKAYQCPMKCEGEKTYAQTGKCPSCGMELAEVK